MRLSAPMRLMSPPFKACRPMLPCSKFQHWESGVRSPALFELLLGGQRELAQERYRLTIPVEQQNVSLCQHRVIATANRLLTRDRQCSRSTAHSTRL